MNDLLAARKIPYFEFIQPNQYYPTNRQFSADEKKIAFDEKSQYKEGTIKGYPKLLAKVSSLQARGVKVFNAVNLFDETRDPVYSDVCCHYNDVGNRSEEHTSELQSPCNLVCRLLLEKKKNKHIHTIQTRRER